MAVPLRNDSHVPTIRCSNCGFDIGLEMMADHVCSQTSHSQQHSPEVIPFRGLPPPSNRDTQGRDPRRPMQLPKIDPHAASRPGQYPYPGELTPASSGHGSQVVSPRSDSSSSFRVPWPMPPPPSRKMSTPIVRGPPSPELISQDCPFPPFPIMPKTRSNTPNSDSDGETLRKPAYPRSKTSSPRGSIHTTNSNTPMPRSRRASTASSKSTSNSRARAKTIETKQETPTGTSAAAAAVRRRPSVSNLFGLRKTPAEQMPPLPSTIPSMPGSRKGSKDDQVPLQPVQSAPAGLPVAPSVTAQQPDLEQLQRFDFQVSKQTSDSESAQESGIGSRSRDRASAASSIYADVRETGVAITIARPSSEEMPDIDRERQETLSRLDGPSNAFAREPSYKAKRPSPIDSTLEVESDRPHMIPPKRSPTFPTYNIDGRTGNGPNGIMGRRPSDSSSALSPPNSGSLLSPIRTSTFPPNSIGNLNSPRPVPTSTSAMPSTPASFEMDLKAQPATTGPLTNLTRASMDSASSYGSDASLAHSTSSQSSPPRDEVRQEIKSLRRESQTIGPFSTDLPQPQRPRLSRMQTDSPTDPLFQNGLLSPIPPSPSATTDGSSRFASDGFDFGRSPPKSIEALATDAKNGFEFRPRQMSSAGEDRPKQLVSRHVPQRSQTMGANKGICRGCDKVISSRQKSVSSADGRLTGKYHKECFVCYTCKSAFATADFYVLRDLPYCAHHYHELNGTLCVGCGRGIEGQYLESNTNRSAPSRKFHAHCLTCATCRCQLRDDYFEFNGRVFCERDAFRAASPHTSRSQYDTAPSRPSPLSQGMFRADSDAGSRQFPERRTTKLMLMGANGKLDVL